MSGAPSASALNIGLTVSWEADVWGQIRAGVRSAEANAQAVEADYVFAQDQFIKFDGAERDALRGLEVLLGRYPNATIEIANLLPTFSLTATLSGASDFLANILSPTNMPWQLVGNLLAPLFDGGKGKIDVEIVTVEQKAITA